MLIGMNVTHPQTPIFVDVALGPRFKGRWWCCGMTA